MEDIKNFTVKELLTKRIEENLSAIDIDSMYDNMLNEIYSFECVGGIFSAMSPARVLKNIDETAYRCGKNDWLDGQDNWTEWEGDYFQSDEIMSVKDDLESDLESIVESIEDIEDRADDLEHVKGLLNDLKKFF